MFRKFIATAFIIGGIAACGYAGTVRVAASGVTGQSAGFAYFATDTAVSLVDSLAAPNAFAKLELRSGGASMTQDSGGSLSDTASVGASDFESNHDGVVSDSTSTKAGAGGLAPNIVVPAPAAALLGVLGCSLLAGLRRKLA